MPLLFFLFKVFAISFSGAIQPGPVTATAINMGSRHRYAGAFITLGHAIIELPLMILIIIGLDRILKIHGFQIIVGLIGGVLLILMGIQMHRDTKKPDPPLTASKTNKAVLAGILLSASNPYFLIWWATIGLNLVIQAKPFGPWVFVLFALVHWLSDGIWFQALSWTAFKGASVMGPKAFKIVLNVCAAAMCLFGAKFIYDAVIKML